MDVGNVSGFRLQVKDERKVSGFGFWFLFSDVGWVSGFGFWTSAHKAEQPNRIRSATPRTLEWFGAMHQRPIIPPRAPMPPYSLRCRANMPHVRQSRPDSGLGVQAKVLEPFSVVPSLLGSGTRASGFRLRVPNFRFGGSG